MSASGHTTFDEGFPIIGPGVCFTSHFTDTSGKVTTTYQRYTEITTGVGNLSKYFPPC